MSSSFVSLWLILARSTTHSTSGFLRSWRSVPTLWKSLWALKATSIRNSNTISTCVIDLFCSLSIWYWLSYADETKNSSHGSSIHDLQCLVPRRTESYFWWKYSSNLGEASYYSDQEERRGEILPTYLILHYLILNYIPSSCFYNGER